MNNFNNKTVFITGGASGIGLGMAKVFAEEGMNLALADIDRQALTRVKTEFSQQGIEVLTFTLDITDANALKMAAASTQTHFGAIHLLCANAGVTGQMGPLDEARDKDWEWAIDVNVKGTVNTIQAFLPFLLEHQNSSHIVITCSISGLRVYTPSRGQGMYNTTKYALLGLGEALSIDLEKYGTGVSLLCPGVVNTPFSDAGRNRAEKYGGAFDLTGEHDLAKLAASGTDPMTYARWVVKAIKRNQLYVITHAADRELVEARHQRIMQAFDDCEKLTSAN